MAFRTRVAAQPVQGSPEELHRNLPKGPEAVQNLWTHQSDVLRAYVEKCQNISDVALELPTGTGKTLPGLLLAEWTMRQKQGRVIYACPTRQLARQVLGVATREGIQAALLVGNHRHWDNESRASFAAAKQIAITTYSSIFNSSPKFQTPETIVFDDAHAGEQYVAGAYSLQIERHNAEETYQAILNAIGPALDGVYRERLREPGNKADTDKDIRLVIPAQDVRIQESLESTLSSELTGPHWHEFAMIRSGLASCLVFIDARSVLVRPLVPPTYQNGIFSEASQRIYLSATLGQGGELERAFGRSPITRIPLPKSSPVPRSGRRLFVFADLVQDTSPDEVSESITSEIGKALILTPDRAASEKLANVLKQDGWPVYTNDHVETHLDDFKSSNSSICALASRFDGIDFPDDTCRLVVQEGLPDNTTHIESFLSGRARAGLALAERVRTRVVQASGRCTRGPSDYAVVVVRGSKLTNYYLAPENLRHLDAEVQAEIQFGYDNSRASASEVLENVRLFMGRKPDWFEVAEPDIIERRQEIESLEVVGAEALAVAAVLEIEACSEASAGRWQQASSIMERAASKAGAGGDRTRGYRAFLLYLAATWTHCAGVSLNDQTLTAKASDMARQAEKAAKPAQWVKLMAPFGPAASKSLEPEDDLAIRKMLSMLRAKNIGSYLQQLEDIVDRLSQTRAPEYESALVDLGRFLGADSLKPKSKGRCDAVWCWSNERWLALEAKSEQDPNELIPHWDIRQVNDQLRLLQGDREADEIPLGSATVLISPRHTLERAAHGAAEDHVFLMRLEEVESLAVMPTEVVDAAGGCACDGGVVSMEIVGVHPVLEPASAVGF